MHAATGEYPDLCQSVSKQSSVNELDGHGLLKTSD